MTKLEDYSLDKLEVKKRLYKEELQEIIDYSIMYKISKKIGYNIYKILIYFLVIEMVVFTIFSLLIMTPLLINPSQENAETGMSYIPLMLLFILPIILTAFLLSTDQTGPKRRLLRDIERVIKIKQEMALDNVIDELGDESEKLEYKSSFKYDYNEKNANNELKKEVIQTLVGFMNNKGGVLVIGIDNNKKVLGIEKDLKLFGDWDKYLLGIQNAIRDFTKSALSDFFEVKRKEKEGKEICVIYVKPCPNVVYYVEGNNEDFYVRQGNQTVKLTTKQANEYIKTHWHNNN